ncbi:MAG: HEAT repeat domain-containing protein [Planctomycetota bacterium]
MQRFPILVNVFFVATAVFAAGCSSAQTEPNVSARDRAKVANDHVRISIGTNSGAGPLTGAQSSAALAEESAARRSANRRAVLAARKDQDRAFNARANDELFVNLYKTDDRNDSIKLYLYGRALGKLQKLSDAMLQFDAAAAGDAKNPWPHEGLGVCYYLQKQYDRAIAKFRKAVEIDPEIAEGYFGLSRALQAANRLDGADGAISAAESCIRCDEDPVRGPLLLSELRMQRNEIEKAIAALKPAVERAPEETILRFALAEAYGKNGNAIDAAAQLEVARKKGNLPPDQLLKAVKLYRRAEHFDRAIELLERLMKEAPAEFWKTNPREEIEQLMATVQEEKKLGHQIEYNLGELVTMLKSHPDAERRKFAAGMIKSFPMPEIDQAFVQALQDASADIRMIAVSEVGRRAKELSVKALSVLSRGDRDDRVRAAACGALGLIDVKESHAALAGALDDDAGHVRAAANRALELLTGRILLPTGAENLDKAGRKDAQEKWKAVLLERKPKASGGEDEQIPAPIIK